MKVLLAGLLSLATLSFQSTQSPPRDVRREPPGVASIAGIVETTDPTPRPLRLAVVTLTGDQLLASRDFRTGADGRFEFTDLPAGQYTVSAHRSSYVRTTYGAKRLGGTGTSIVLAAGQKLSTITIGLAKYSVITGTIYDQSGEPAQGVSVEVMAYTMRTGRRTLSSVYGRPQTTDDRGIYRAGGLVPGEYYVAAGPSSDNYNDGTAEIQILAAAEIDRAMQPSPPGRSTTPANPTPTRVNFAPVFFPGATVLAGATKLTLGPGEERTGVDFNLQFVPTARLSGTVADLDGQPAANAQVVATMVTEASSLDLFRGTIGTVQTDAQGRFSYAGLSPGQYEVTARLAPARVAPGTGPGSSWARADVNIAGDDQSVALALQPPMTVSGKVVFDGNTLQPPAALTALRVGMQAVQTAPTGWAVTPALVNADRTFVIRGVTPGTYRITAPAPAAPSGWMLRSAVLNNVDLLDAPLLAGSIPAIEGVVVTFTDHPSELSGLLQTPESVPTSNYFMIIFATDKRFWTSGSRRTVMARPASNGRYLVRNLPPGEYYVAAVTDAEFNAWFDPAFLEELVPSATKVMIEEGGKKVLDLKIAGGG